MFCPRASVPAAVHVIKGPNFEPLRGGFTEFGSSAAVVPGNGDGTFRAAIITTIPVAPTSYTSLTVAATAFTVIWIVPVNHRLFKEISDPAVFTATLRRWVVLNVIRSGLWALEWVAIAWWFVRVATREV